MLIKSYCPSLKEIEKLCNDIQTQQLYQKLGVLDKGKSKSTPKTRWHAQGGLDLANWLVRENHWIMHVKKQDR